MLWKKEEGAIAQAGRREGGEGARERVGGERAHPVANGLNFIFKCLYAFYYQVQLTSFAFRNVRIIPYSEPVWTKSARAEVAAAAAADSETRSIQRRRRCCPRSTRVAPDDDDGGGH